METKKICRSCKKEKPIERFAPIKGREGYRRPNCKDCLNAKERKQWAEATKKKLKEKELRIEQNKINYPEIFERFSGLPTTNEDAVKINSKRFFTGEFCKNGHLCDRRTGHRACMECVRELHRADIEKSKANGTYEIRRAKLTKYIRDKRRSDPEVRKYNSERAKVWKQNNRERLNAYARKLRAENPHYQIQDRLQARIKKVLKNKNVRKSDKFIDYLGCDLNQLIKHLESQFTENMNWDNRDEWSVDHIRPCKSFDLTNNNQAKVCFNWRNLQPLWNLDNLKKKDTYSLNDEEKWVKKMRELNYQGDLYLAFE